MLVTFCKHATYYLNPIWLSCLYFSSSKITIKFDTPIFFSRLFIYVSSVVAKKSSFLL